MRRKEREIKSFDDIIAVVGACKEMSLAMSKDDMPYIATLNFGFSVLDGKLSLYFHCAKEGKKIDILKANANVCFSMYSLADVKLNEVACKSTNYYQSVIGEGRVVFLDNEKDKFAAMENIMLHYGYKGQMNFAAALERTLLCKIEVSSVTGKQNLPS